MTTRLRDLKSYNDGCGSHKQEYSAHSTTYLVVADVTGAGGGLKNREKARNAHESRPAGTMAKEEHDVRAILEAQAHSLLEQSSSPSVSSGAFRPRRS